MEYAIKAQEKKDMSEYEKSYQKQIASKIKQTLMVQKKEWNAMMIRFQRIHLKLMQQRKTEKESISKTYINTKCRIMQQYNIKKPILKHAHNAASYSMLA